jgi:hypothetical protein
VVQAVLAALGAYGMTRGPLADAGVTEIKMPDNVPEETLDFESQGIET